MLIKPISPDEIERVAALHESQNERAANCDFIRRCIAEFPSAIALHQGDAHLGEVLGFVYTERLAPDLLNLANILVADNHRGLGVGTRLLKHIEESSRESWSGIVLTNSDLWPHPPRPSPLPFYLKNGYEIIWETPQTTVMAKRLGR